MAVIPVPSWSDGNGLYPLPPDYNTLNPRGKRLARINGLRQFTLWNPVKHPSARAEAYAAAVSFYDNYYLRRVVLPSGAIDFDPYYYKGDPLPSPDFHWLWTRAMATIRKCAAVAPRGGAKSFLLGKCIQVDLLTVPRTEDLYCTSSNDLAESMGDRVKYQLYYNSRVQDDWGPEYGGNAKDGLKPARSEGKMGMTDFSLINRSSLICSSAKSRQRGRRPNKYILDDPEYDPSASTEMELLNDYMENFIRAVILPMVQGPGDSVFWCGTFISRRHYLWAAMETEEVEIDGVLTQRSIDPYYDDWFRIVTSAELETPTGLKSFWPYKHPINDAERIALGVDPSTRTLPEVEKEITTPVYNSEYRAKPGVGIGAHFPLLEEERHGYWFEEVDSLFQTEPTQSLTKIVWFTELPTGREKRTLSLKDFCTRYPRLITIDGAYTEKATSDYKGCMALTLTDENDLFALDLYAAKERDESICTQIFSMTDRWLANSLHPELSDDAIKLTELLTSLLKFRAQEIIGTKHLPALAPFKPGFIDKPTKINAALSWRFEHNKIKLPLRKMKQPGVWRMLKDQIVGFNPLAPNGGLRNDDCIDLLAMHIKAISGLAARYHTEKSGKEVKTARERLLAGEKIDKMGNPLILEAMMDPLLTLADIRSLITPKLNPKPADNLI